MSYEDHHKVEVNVKTVGHKGCSFPGCDRPHRAKGWCRPHYKQQYDGAPMTVRRAHLDRLVPPATMCTDGVNFIFEILSPKHGRFMVTAPLRFRAEIEAHTWHVIRQATRALGRQFVARTTIRTSDPAPRREGLSLHALVWELAGNAPAPEIDHRDGQPLNNSEDNLRAATSSQNQANTRPPRHNSSGVKGVSRQGKKWRVQINVAGRKLNVGSFVELSDAAEAYKASALKHFGAFAEGANS